MNVEWIHVRTADKLPLSRPSKTSPFEFYPEGFDPNDAPAFGPDMESMFLLVVRNPPPVYNDVINQIQIITTTGVDSLSYPGQYIDPNWVVAYQLLAQTPQVSINNKLAQLQADYEAAILNGYTVNGTLQLSYADEFYQRMACQLSMSENSLARGSITVNTQIKLSDIDGEDITTNLTQLRSVLNNYNVARGTINNKYVTAKGQIVRAVTNEARNAVTWSF